nr:hypothetical protein [Actinomycetota bacterium]
FTAFAERTALLPDETRTALLRRKLADPRIQRLFPWWWWCCDDPNVVFSVTQAGNVLLDEDPATETRWCLEDGSDVTLVGNASSVTLCPGGPNPAQGFVWIKVGDTTVDHIHDGYADGTPGSDASDMAFAGSVDIYGGFASVPAVAAYQVNLAPLSGDPARGPVSVGSPTPLGTELSQTLLILHSGGSVTFHAVKMGPFNAGSRINLYATEEGRPGIGPAFLPPLPPHSAGDALFWASPQLRVATSTTALVGGTAGSVELTISTFDAAFAPIGLTSNTDDHLRLTIDNTPLATHSISTPRAFNSSGVAVGLSTGTTTACPSYDLGPGGYVEFDVSVSDGLEHLFEYELVTEFGSGSSALVPSITTVGSSTVTTPSLRGYAQAGPFPGGPYKAPDASRKAFGGGSDTYRFYPLIDCCYDFRLFAGKRLTNGSWGPSTAVGDAFQTATLKVSS